VVLTATNGLAPDAQQSLIVTVVQPTNQPPVITSANAATFQAGKPGTFTVTTAGFPVPAITESGALPAGISFADNGDGTATLSGTASGSGSSTIVLTAANGSGPNAVQNLTLIVTSTGQGPVITSASSAIFAVNVQGSFTVTTTGSPTPSITESGALPPGVAFIDNGNGTGTLSGTPTTSGAFSITFTAANGAGSNAVQNFTLNVAGTGTLDLTTGASQPIVNSTGQGFVQNLRCTVTAPVTGEPNFALNISKDGTAIYNGPLYSNQDHWAPFFLFAKVSGRDGSQVGDTFEIDINSAYTSSLSIVGTLQSPAATGALSCSVH
jgi:hypothetical protein